MSFDDVLPLEFMRMALITSLDRTALFADAKTGFRSLSLYTWGDEFFWGVDYEGLS